MRFAGCSILLLLLFCSAFSSGKSWNLVKDKEGIQLYFRDMPGSSIPEFLVTMTIDGDIDKILEALNDPAGCKKWVHKCREAKVLEKLGHNVQYRYQVSDLPFMFRDRDIIFKASLEVLESGEEYHINFHSDADYCRENDSAHCADINKSSYVRVKHSQGTYRLKKLNEGRVSLTWQQHIEPSLPLPRWLLLSQLENIPFHSMRKLKNSEGL